MLNSSVGRLGTLTFILAISTIAGCATSQPVAPASQSTAPASQPLGYDAALKSQYRSIFTGVLERFVSSKPGPNICLPPLFGYGEIVTEPVEVVPQMEMAMPGLPAVASRAAQFKALEAAGLVTSTEIQRTTNGKPASILSYKRTPLGQAMSQGGSICYARGELEHLVKWKGPVILGQYQAAFVYYTVKVTHIEDWAKRPDIQAAFPTTEPIIKGEPPKVRQAVIDLSSEGWDIAEYSKYVQMQ